MAGLRWRAPTALTLLGVFAVCLILQQSLPLSAEDKPNSPTNTAVDKKADKKLDKKSVSKKKRMQAADEPVDSSPVLPGGNSTGAGAGAGVQSGTTNSGNANSGSSSNGQNKNSATNPQTSGATVKTPAVTRPGNTGKKVVAKPGSKNGTKRGSTLLNAKNPLVAKVIQSRIGTMLHWCRRKASMERERDWMTTGIS